MDWESIFSNTLESAIGRDAMVFALAAIGLNLHFGYTGLLNFGQAGFMAVGAYGVGITVVEFDAPLWVGVIVGIVGAVGLALLLGLPTLRLRADYLAITTIAAGEILRFIFRAAEFRDFTGGSNGINGFARDFTNANPFNGDFELWLISFSATQMWYLTVGWALVLLSVLLIWLLTRSPWGRVLKAIREDEDAVRALGKNVYAYKMQSLIVGGVIGSLAGMMLAISARSVQPDNYGTPTTFFAYACLILGGAATIWGPVVGSMIFWSIMAFTENLLRQLVENDHIPDSIMSGVQVGQVRFMLMGLGLALLMIFRPQGVFGDRREIALTTR
ncbi:MAG: branched-chain amino acid ABC transporter permease [Thermoanaerobacterales bacterium]|jgi:branched-chain amino acid transport system permease protein|nr:branched-chain amino acid ABC transporter permease [Thermoanaerobacterales bacterium]